MVFEATKLTRWRIPGGRRSMLFLGVSSILSSACAHTVRPFPLVDPVWEDQDRHHVKEEPAEYYSGLMADGADKNLFRPLARLPYLPLPERAANVNSLDEVPNSSWFQNRLGSFDFTPERLAKAACAETPPLNPEESWEIIAAKPNGAFPGFFIKVREQRYLLKFDSPVQPGRATSADVIGSKIYWAAGYHTPCNEIIYFDRDILSIGEGATAEDDYGRKRPITQEDVDQVLSKAMRTKDGVFRASASRFVPGQPLGPFKYQGKRKDDPNDTIRHERRRELRANRVLSAWLHHHDAREQNSLDVWMTGQGAKKRSYIEHYMIDWGDCLGSRWEFNNVSKRFGYSYFLDFDQILVDTLTLGIYPRPWHHVSINPEAEIFGYYNVKDFNPKTWVTEYPNAAFSEMRYDDALWMARILARFEDEHLRAIVAEAKLQNPVAEEYLFRTLKGRRDKILEAYFLEYAPLDNFKLVRRDPGDPAQSICFDDLAIKRGIIDHERVLYKVRYYAGKKLDDEIGWLQIEPDADHPSRSCIKRPQSDPRPSDRVPKGAAADDPRRYMLMKIWIHQQASLSPTSSIHLHFYDQGSEKGLRLVGIERPDKPTVPDSY